MKSQIQKGKIKDFMKIINEGSIFQSSQLKLQQGIQNDSSKGFKRKSNLITFLQKIKQPIIQVMEKYLNQNKNEPHCIKNKITLYQDITIIYEFRKYLSQIQYDTTKMTQTICSRLQGRLNRAKITIKERIAKKLSHLSQQDIIHAIKNNRDFIFCNKSKKPIPFSQLPPLQGQNSLASDRELQTRVKQDQLFTMQSSLKNQKQIKLQQTPIQLRYQHKKKEGYKYRTNKLYKYGSKDNKKPIYIHATINPRTIKVVSYSVVMQLRQKYKFQQKPTETEQTPINEKKDLFKIVCSFSQEFNRFVQSKSLNKMQKEQILEYLSSTKEKAISILQSCKSHKDASQIHQTIDKVSKHLNNLIQQIDESNNNFIVPKEQEIPNQTKELPTLDQSQINERKLLFSVSNSMHTYKLLGQNKYLANQIHWSQQEDSLLYFYAFDNQKYTTQVKCLLRYKNQASIVNRIKFLCVPKNQQTFKHLHSLSQINQ